MKTLIQTNNIRVKFSLKNTDACVITFDSYTDTGDFNREAFGERYFSEQNLSVVHVVNRRNDWYHNDDWLAALSAVRSLVAGHRRTIAYGSSMGGYAALRFAEFLGVSAVVAISPQYHMARHRVPFETRWRRDARQVRWRPELDVRLGASIPAIVVYDPFLPGDRMHVDLIATEADVVDLCVPYSGHPSGTYLAECGLLGPLIQGVVRGDVSVPDISSAARASRHVSLSYFITLAARAIKRRPQLAVRLASRAVALEPEVYYAWMALGQAYRRAGQMPDAVAAMRRALALAPDHPTVMATYGQTLAYNGEGRAACRYLVAAATVSGRRGAGFAFRTALLLVRGRTVHLMRRAGKLFSRD